MVTEAAGQYPAVWWTEQGCYTEFTENRCNKEGQGCQSKPGNARWSVTECSTKCETGNWKMWKW